MTAREDIAIRDIIETCTESMQGLVNNLEIKHCDMAKIRQRKPDDVPMIPIVIRIRRKITIACSCKTTNKSRQFVCSLL
jgi:hypothetical protein